MFVHVSVHVYNLDFLQWSHLKKNLIKQYPSYYRTSYKGMGIVLF